MKNSKLKNRLYEQKQYVPTFTQYILENEELEDSDMEFQKEYNPGKDDSDEEGENYERDMNDEVEESDHEENINDEEDEMVEEDGNPSEAAGTVSAAATKFLNGLSKGKLSVSATVSSKANTWVKNSGVKTDNALLIQGAQNAGEFKLPGVVVVSLDGGADGGNKPETISDDAVCVATKDANASGWVKLTFKDLKSAMANSDAKTWFENLAKAPKLA
jgi:hypothetical protein